MMSSLKNIPYCPKVKNEALCNILPSCRPGFLGSIAATFPDTVIDLTVLTFVPNLFFQIQTILKRSKYDAIRKDGLTKTQGENTN